MTDPLARLQRRAEKRTLPPGVAFPRTFRAAGRRYRQAGRCRWAGVPASVRGQGWYARNPFASTAGAAATGIIDL